MEEMKALPGHCEEASPHSKQHYLPCNQPAVRLVWSPRDQREYRMCATCADHSVKNRGFQDRGAYAKASLSRDVVNSPDDDHADAAAYASDAAPIPRGPENILAQITRVARELRSAEEDVTRCEEHLKQAQDHVKSLREGTLPQLMDEAQQTKLTTLDGYDLSRADIIRASIPEGRMEQAAPWLREHGNAALIRRVISVEFGPGADERATRLVEVIRREGFNEWKDKVSVNAQSLSAAVREMVREGEEVAMELLGVHVQPVVTQKIAAARMATKTAMTRGRAKV